VELEPEDDTGAPEWELEAVLDSRLHYGKLQYWVQWTGYESVDEGWVYAYDMEAPKLIEEFHAKYPGAVKEDAPPQKSKKTKRKRR
jgi:hypothetical protein